LKLLRFNTASFFYYGLSVVVQFASACIICPKLKKTYSEVNVGFLLHLVELDKFKLIIREYAKESCYLLSSAGCFFFWCCLTMYKIYEFDEESSEIFLK